MVSPKACTSPRPMPISAAGVGSISAISSTCAPISVRTACWSSARRTARTTGGSAARKLPALRRRLAAVAPQAGLRGVTILMEALPLGQCDVSLRSTKPPRSSARSITPLSAHVRLSQCRRRDRAARRAGRSYYDLIRHIHVNELDGRHLEPALRFQAALRSVAPPRVCRLDLTRSFDFTGRGNHRPRVTYISGNPMSKYVVTGGAGFIGSAIVRGLFGKARARSWCSIIPHRPPAEPRRSPLRHRPATRRHSQLRGDRPILSGADVVFHEAAIHRYPALSTIPSVARNQH